MTDFTQLLLDASGGDVAAQERLQAPIYEELRRITDRLLSSGRHTLDTLPVAALIHEAHMRLVDFMRCPPSRRELFYCVACSAMRRILVDLARREKAIKHGGTRRAVSLGAALASGAVRSDLLLALDEALAALGESDRRRIAVVECMVFGGLTVGETAGVLLLARRGVERDWQGARENLLLMLEDER